MVPQVRPRLRVQPRGGLVQEQQRRVVDQPHGDIETAPLPPRQRVAAPVALVGQVQFIQQPPRTLSSLVPRDAVQPGMVDDLLARSRFREAGTPLGHQPDAGPHAHRIGDEIVAGHDG